TDAVTNYTFLLATPRCAVAVKSKKTKDQDAAQSMELWVNDHFSFNGSSECEKPFMEYCKCENKFTRKRELGGTPCKFQVHTRDAVGGTFEDCGNLQGRPRGHRQSKASGWQGHKEDDIVVKSNTAVEADNSDRDRE
ncbi:hypothetical protein MTO96_040468, partial [Rhipicephalus appendiculatus]